MAVSLQMGFIYSHTAGEQVGWLPAGPLQAPSLLLEPACRALWFASGDFPGLVARSAASPRPGCTTPRTTVTGLQCKECCRARESQLTARVPSHPHPGELITVLLSAKSDVASALPNTCLRAAGFYRNPLPSLCRGVFTDGKEAQVFGTDSQWGDLDPSLLPAPLPPHPGPSPGLEKLVLGPE